MPTESVMFVSRTTVPSSDQPPATAEDDTQVWSGHKIHSPVRTIPFAKVDVAEFEVISKVDAESAEKVEVAPPAERFEESVRVCPCIEVNPVTAPDVVMPHVFEVMPTS